MNKGKKTTEKAAVLGYVAYAVEHLRDEDVECAMVFKTKEAALDWIEKLANGFGSYNMDFALYELGQRVPLEEYAEMEQPKPKVKRRRFK